MNLAPHLTHSNVKYCKADIMLLVELFKRILFDFVRCPLQLIFNFFCYTVPSTTTNFRVNRMGIESIEDVCILLHHYAPYGIKYEKRFKEKIHVVGIGAVLHQLRHSGLQVNCFVADADADYFATLQSTFSFVNFINTSGEKYDFRSYLNAPTLVNEGCSYYCMFNDNVGYESDILSFVRGAKQSIVGLDLGVIGVGSNTYLTQSVFKNSFSPHVQTYGFLVRRELFDLFAIKFQWYLNSCELKFLLKPALCRVLEQGLSKFILKNKFGLGFLQNSVLITYRRRFYFLDLKKDWYGELGDSREVCEKPFVFDWPKNSVFK